MSFSCSPSLTLLIQKPTKDAIYIKAWLNFWRIDCTLWKGILDRNWDTSPKTLGWEHCKVRIIASTNNHSGHIEKIVLPILVKTISPTQAAVYFSPHTHTHTKIMQKNLYLHPFKRFWRCGRAWMLARREGHWFHLVVSMATRPQRAAHGQHREKLPRPFCPAPALLVTSLQPITVFMCL